MATNSAATTAPTSPHKGPSALSGVVREHIVIGGSLIGGVETVDETNEITQVYRSKVRGCVPLRDDRKRSIQAPALELVPVPPRYREKTFSQNMYPTDYVAI